MSRIVYLPDYSTVNAPDNMSDEQAISIARERFPEAFVAATPIAPPKPKPEPGIASEIGSILKSGTGQGIASLGKLGQYAGIGGKGLEEYGTGMTQRATEALSPSTQASLQRQFIKEAPEGQGFFGYQLGDAGIKDIPAQALQSIPMMAGTMAAAAGATALAPEAAVAGAGAGLLSLLGRIGLGNVAGRIATAAGTKAGAAELLAGKLAINTLAGNVGEGLAAAGSSGIETEKAIHDFAQSDPDSFFQSPIGQQALKDADGDKKKAIELGAFRAGRSAAAYTGVSTAILATPGSAFESLAVFGKGVRSGRLHNAIMGGITEGPAQELPQGSAEQYIQNLQRIQAGEKISSGKGVLEAGVQGAIVGTPIGGALGAITGSGKPPAEIPASDVDMAFVAQHKANLEAGMEPHEAYMGAANPVLAQAPEGAVFTVYDASGQEYEAQLVGRQEGTPLIQVDGAEKGRNYVLGDEFTVTNPLNEAVTTSDGIPVSSLSGEALTNKVDEVHTKVLANDEAFKQNGIDNPQYHIDARDLTALTTRVQPEKVPLTDKQKVQEQKDFNKQKREVVKSAKQPAPPVAEVPPPVAPLAAPAVAPTIVAPAVAPVPPPVVTPVVPPAVPIAADNAPKGEVKKPVALEEPYTPVAVVPGYASTGVYAFKDENGVKYNVNPNGDVHVELPPNLRNKFDGESVIIFREGDGRRNNFPSDNLPSFVPAAIKAAIAAHVAGKGRDGGVSMANVKKAVAEVRKQLTEKKTEPEKKAKPEKKIVTKPKTQEEELQDQVDEETPTLPAELAKATPRFNVGTKSAIPTFASDVDKAAFIVSGKGESARHQDYFDWVMKATGLTKEQVIDHGNQVRREIKDSMEDVRKDGTLYIPESQLFDNKYDRAIGELSDLSLSDLRKSEVTAFANRLVKQGLVKESDLSDVREILKDKDQVADDAVGELESIIESSKPAKFSKTTKGKAKEKSTTTAAETVAKRREATKQERVNRAIPRIAKLVSDRLAKIGLGKYIDPVVLEATIGEEVEGKQGSWTHLITLAVNGKSDNQIMSALNHESIHAMREIGMITPDEWKSLTAVAKAKDWITLFNIKDRYAKLSENDQYEEAIADAWSTYATGRSPIVGYESDDLRPVYIYKAQLKLGGQPVGILTRIKKILGIIKDVAAEEKLGEDVFKRIEEAPIAATKPVQGAAPAKLSVSPKDGVIPAEPGTTPIPKGTVRLYHQTDEKSLASIEKSGLLYKNAKGIEGPKAIYAGELPFYGDIRDHPTLEFYVPKDQWDAPFVLSDVPVSQIIAAHAPWQGQARYIENEPETLQRALDGGFDDLTGDYAKAIEYIKTKYQPKPAKLSVTKADLGREKTGQLYEVYNRKTGKVVGGPYQTRSAARSGADRNDNKYGGYAHDVREVQEFGSDEGPEPTKQDLKKAREEEKLEALDETGVNPKFSLALKKKTITQRSTQDDLGPVFVYTGDIPDSLDEYLKESTIKKDGLPRIGFHGTAQDISTFRAKQAGAIFVTFDPSFAEGFAMSSEDWMKSHWKDILTSDQQDAVLKEVENKIKKLPETNLVKNNLLRNLKENNKFAGVIKDMIFEAVRKYMPSAGNIMPLFVNAKDPFDYENETHVQSVIAQMIDNDPNFSATEKDRLGATFADGVAEGQWTIIESPAVQEAIKDLGYDSFYINEAGFKNLAVYNSSQLKSAIGNNGEYDPKNDNIKLSVAPKRSSDIGHKQEKSSGRFIGAPKWVGSSTKNLNLLGSRLDKLAEEGAVGKFWYERSSKAILDMVNGDKKLAEQFVGLVALFSAGNQVSNNMGMAIKAWYEWKNTGKITAGRFPATQGPKAERWLNDGIDYGGIKVNNFYTDLMEEIDPASVDKEHSTMDMWMALAGDYGSKILDQGPKYLFMQREIKRIADNMGWKPHQVQAAIWTAIKARVEKSEAERNAYELRKGIAVMKMVRNADTGKTTLTHSTVKGKEYEHFRAASKFGFDSSITQAEIDSSFYDFRHSIEERTVQISSEAIPGVTSDVLPGIHDAPMWQKIEYSEAVRAGKFLENIYKKLGMLSSIGGVSFSGWQGVTTVGQQDKIAVRVLNGEVTPESKLLINFATDIYGLVTSQEGVAWHFPIKDSVKFGLNGVDIDIGRKLTESQTDTLYKLLIKELGNTYSPPIPTDTGFRVLNFPDAKFAYDTAKDIEEIGQTDLYNKGILTKYQIALSKANQKFVDGVIRALDKFPYLARSITRFRSDGELRENNWSNGNEDYKERIARTIQELSNNNSRIGFTDLQKWIDLELLSGISTINQKFAKKYGWGTVAKQEKLDLGEQAKFSAAPRRYEQTGDGRGVRGKSGRITPLQGSPSVPSANGPDSRIVAVAQRYAKDNGINFKRQSEYVQVDPVRGKRLADAYEAMAHDPQDPVVKEAYANLMKQTLAQYRALENAGYKFWFINFAKPENKTYAKSPWNAMRDIRANQEMGVFPTTSGFGTDESNVSGNPLLEDTGIKWPDGGLDGPLKPVLANDLFRAVHDAFGHGLEGAGFRADGEDNAFQSHIRMYTGSAKGAITSETRGQNSVVNYGPNAEFNRTANGEDTIYADQKTGLMPEWTWTEGVSKDEPTFQELDAKQDAEMFRKAVDRVKRNRKMAFPLHVHDVNTYRNARLFLSDDKESGFALMGDEIGSFFSGGGGQAYPTLRLAVEEGGKRIDAYRTIMPKVLGKAGFRPVARVAFDPEQATNIWDYKKFAQFQGGKPDLVFFAHDPEFEGDIDEETAKAPLVDYSEAVSLQTEAVSEQQSTYEVPKLSATPKFATAAFGGKPIPKSLRTIDTSGLNEFIWRIQDKFIDLKNIIKELDATVGKVPEKLNAYLKEELFHGKAAQQTKDFKIKEIRPLLVEMDKRKVEMADIEKYLHNRHAEERNDHINKIGGMADGGSGIKTKDAQDYMRSLSSQDRANYEAIAKMVDKITADSRKMLVATGLEDQKTVDAWNAAYDHYVPLNRVQDDDMDANSGRTGMGQGFSVVQKVQRALGSSQEVEHIIANITALRERIIVKAEKNEIGKAVFGLALKYPNSDIWLAVDPEFNKSPTQALNDLLSMGYTLIEAQNLAA